MNTHARKWFRPRLLRGILLCAVAAPLLGQGKENPADPGRAEHAPAGAKKEAASSKKEAVSSKGGRVLTTTWPASPNAPGYVVEIRKPEGEILISKRTDENQIQFQLPPGTYEYRVAVLNKFRKPGPWSIWADLVVRESLVPRLTSVRPRELSLPLPGKSTETAPDGRPRRAPPKTKVLTLTGSNLLPATKVIVQSEAGPVPVERVDYVGPDQMRVLIASAVLRPGRITLRVENPGQKKGRGSIAVAVTEGGPREDIAMIRPMRRDPRRSGAMTPAELARERRAMMKRALIPGMGALERGDPLEIGIWGTLYGSYLLGGIHEHQQARRAAADARAVPIAVFTNPLAVLAVGSRLASSGDSIDVLAAGALTLLSQLQLNELRREYKVHQNRQIALGGLALGTYVVQVYGESFRGFSLGKLVPGLPQLQMGQSAQGIVWASGFAALTAGSYYAYRQGAAEAASIRHDPLISILTNPITAGWTLTELGGARSSAFVATVALSIAKRDSARARYDELTRYQYGLGIGATAVAIAYLVNVPPASNAGGRRFPADSQERHFAADVQGSFPLLYYGPDGRGRTTTQVGWMLLF